MYKIDKSVENTRLFNIMFDSYLRDIIFDIKLTKKCIFFSIKNNDLLKIITKDEGSEDMANFINMLESVDKKGFWSSLFRC